MYASDIRHSSDTLQEKLHTLYTLSRNKKIDLSFRPPFLNLLKALGNPHLKLPPVIHVTGTNGKGSIIAMLKSILETAGYKVHAYTSPHLIDFNERIVLAGEEIENDFLETLIDEALALNDGQEITFFEITTAIAFAAFSKTPADICLLEVGLGGRLDCTNVIEAPIISIINAIGMDHVEYLGGTIESIAAEKAGIMKANVPCVIGHQPHKEVLSVFEKQADKVGTNPHTAEGEIVFETSLPGPHQRANAAAALKALELIKESFPVSDEHIQKGLQNIQWRARLQKLNPEDFGLDKSWNILLDGGHNKDAGGALTRFAQSLDKDLHIIVGMMSGKDTSGFLKALLPHTKSVNVVNIEGEPKSQTAEELASQIFEAQKFETYKDALKHLSALPPANILICGSLYLAGHVLKDISE
ncbi:MAG: folylpolyglutamate synthase/dihydrofolate synthase family protein [Pseudomonadota bacterium]